jgi:hypothetical protein
MADAETTASLQDLSTRLTRIEGTLARLEGMLAGAPGPGMPAEQAAPGPGVPAEQAAPDPASERLHALVARLDALPGVIATVMDTMDEFLLRLADKGVDLDLVGRGGAVAVERVARLMQSSAFHDVLGSGILEPDVVQAVGQVGRALSAATRERGERAGLMALLRATRDPQVQRTIDFGLRFLRHLGERIVQQEAVRRRELSHG